MTCRSPPSTGGAVPTATAVGTSRAPQRRTATRKRPARTAADCSKAASRAALFPIHDEDVRVAKTRVPHRFDRRPQSGVQEGTMDDRRVRTGHGECLREGLAARTHASTLTSTPGLSVNRLFRYSALVIHRVAHSCARPPPTAVAT